jgi:biotin transport system substrate-specific component
MAVTLTTPNTLLGSLQTRDSSRLLANIGLVILGTLLLTATAKVQVPLPPVPFTLQSLAVALIAASAGWRIGVATVALYIAEGLLGLPVFANGGGLAYVMSPSFGFIVGWLPMAYLIGRTADDGNSRNLGLILAAMIIGDAIAFAFGFAWLLVIANALLAAGTALPTWLQGNSLIEAAYYGAVHPFLLWDLLKMAFAAITVTGAWTLLRKRAR